MDYKSIYFSEFIFIYDKLDNAQLCDLIDKVMLRYCLGFDSEELERSYLDKLTIGQTVDEGISDSLEKSKMSLKRTPK